MPSKIGICILTTCINQPAIYARLKTFVVTLDDLTHSTPASKYQTAYVGWSGDESSGASGTLTRDLSVIFNMPLLRCGLKQKKLEKEAWMSYPSVDCTLDFKKSCSKDDAVAKLLGWLRGPICYETVEIAEEGASIEQLKHMETLVFSLEDHLKSLREEALYKASDAVESNSPEDVQQELLNAVLDIEDLIKFARNYLLDIEEELDKGKFSSLTIDQIATNNVGEVCVTLKSLNRWAKTKYGIDILEDNHIPPFDNAILREHKTSGLALHRKQEQAILEAINQLGENPNQLPKNQPGKPGVKAKVRRLLIKNTLFLGSTVFDKAWERLRDFRDIEDSK